MSVGKGKGWLVASSTAASVVAVAAGIVNGTLQWSSEARARQAEVELRVSKEFLTTMEFAHGRSSYVWSEKCAELLFPRVSVGTSGGFEAIEQYNRALEVACAMRLPVGAATQNAEIQMLAEFGIRYPYLEVAAREGLQELIRQNAGAETARRALDRLNNAK
jgi:hypothetical protein